MLNHLKSQLGQSMHTVRRFLERPIRVAEGGLTLGTAAGNVRAQARDERRQRVRRMRRELFLLMQQHPNSRELMRHLDLVERTLRHEGLSRVEALPVRVIAKALGQLEKLVWDWSQVGLAELRSRMAVIVKTRPAEAESEGPSTDSFEADLAGLHAADVTEIDHDASAFEEMERSWAGQVPEGFAQAAAAAKGHPAG